MAVEVGAVGDDVVDEVVVLVAVVAVLVVVGLLVVVVVSVAPTSLRHVWQQVSLYAGSLRRQLFAVTVPHQDALSPYSQSIAKRNIALFVIIVPKHIYIYGSIDEIVYAMYMTSFFTILGIFFYHT